MKIKPGTEKYNIKKTFGFDYAHRVWNQSLDENLSNNSKCSCKQLHGHTGFLTVELEGSTLTNGMLLDFKNLDFIKTLVSDLIDHKCVVDRDDPMLNTLLGRSNLVVSDTDFLVWDKETASAKCILEEPCCTSVSQAEYLKSFTIVRFVPTSENLAKWMHTIISARLASNQGVRVSKVSWKETPKSCASYTISEELV